jgi:hypothetical protein
MVAIHARIKRLVVPSLALGVQAVSSVMSSLTQIIQLVIVEVAGDGSVLLFIGALGIEQEIEKPCGMRVLIMFMIRKDSINK